MSSLFDKLLESLASLVRNFFPSQAQREGLRALEKLALGLLSRRARLVSKFRRGAATAMEVERRLLSAYPDDRRTAKPSQTLSTYHDLLAEHKALLASTRIITDAPLPAHERMRKSWALLAKEVSALYRQGVLAYRIGGVLLLIAGLAAA